MTGNYQPFLLLRQPFVCIYTSIYYLVCESTLFKVTFETPTCQKTLLDRKRCKGHCIYLKLTFRIPLSLENFMNWKLVSTLANMVYVFAPWSAFEIFKQIICVLTLVVSSILFSNLLFSKMYLKFYQYS